MYVNGLLALWGPRRLRCHYSYVLLVLLLQLLNTFLKWHATVTCCKCRNAVRSLAASLCQSRACYSGPGVSFYILLLGVCACVPTGWYRSFQYRPAFLLSVFAVVTNRSIPRFTRLSGYARDKMDTASCWPTEGLSIQRSPLIFERVASLISTRYGRRTKTKSKTLSTR